MSSRGEGKEDEVLLEAFILLRVVEALRPLMHVPGLTGTHEAPHSGMADTQGGGGGRT